MNSRRFEEEIDRDEDAEEMRHLRESHKYFGLPKKPLKNETSSGESISSGKKRNNHVEDDGVVTLVEEADEETALRLLDLPTSFGSKSNVTHDRSALEKTKREVKKSDWTC